MPVTEKQISIISAAIEIFAEKGYSATTTSAIAKKAGVGEGTIFHHFKTKKDLLLAIPEYLNQSAYTKQFMQGLYELLEQPPAKFEDFLRALVQNRMGFAAANFKLIKVLFQEVPFHPEIRTKISETVFFPAFDKFIAALNKYQERGQIVDMPAVLVFKLIFTTVFGYLFTRYIAMFDFNWASEKETDYLVQYIMQGISGGVR